MILINYIGFLSGVAALSFVFFAFLKLMLSTKNTKRSLAGIWYFVISSFYLPISIANDIFRKRKGILKMIRDDDELSDLARKKLEKLVQSRHRLYLKFTKDHILNFSDFIETFLIAYRVFCEDKDRITEDKKNDSKVELISEIVKKYDPPHALNDFKEKYS